MTKPKTDSPIIATGLPCPLPDCGSSDAASLREDTSGYCFSCESNLAKGWLDSTDVVHAKAMDVRTLNKAAAKGRTVEAVEEKLEGSSVVAWVPRKISQATMEHWDVRMKSTPFGWEVYEPWKEGGATVALKVRKLGKDPKNNPDKKFYWVGKEQKGLWGKWLWGSKGKYVVITEGGVDALSVSQAFRNQYAVVSVPNGHGSLRNAIAHDMEWLSGYENIVLLMDSEVKAQQSAREAARLLPPGRVRIRLPPLPS